MVNVAAILAVELDRVIAVEALALLISIKRCTRRYETLSASGVFRRPKQSLRFAVVGHAASAEDFIASLSRKGAL